MALVKFVDGPSAYAASLVMKAKGWHWVFDEDGSKLEMFLKKKNEPTATPVKKPLEHRKPLAEVRQSLSCHSKIPCILVDYEFFPYREASADLVALFGKYRLHSLQRGKESWHIHLYNEEDVEDAYLNRYSFEFNGRRIRPYLSSTLVPKKQPERAPRTSLPANTTLIDDLRSKILESTLNNTNSVDKELKVLEPFVPINQDLLNIPMFNKKYLEKLEAMPEEEDNESEEEADEEESLTDHSESESAISEKAEGDEMVLDMSPSVPPSQEELDEDLEELVSGSARLEGYYKQTHKKVWFEPLQAPASLQAQTKVRTGRATSRRFDSQLAELMGKLSSLQIRQKALILNRSSIHSYGLFAGEDIEPGELVIEYVGEIIRHSLANIRERRYEQALKAAGSDDIASSYFFRLDLTYVVDASNRGNLARFVNHSCDPNCTAKVVQIEGAQHIVFYARRPIAFGEEITYDYKFAIEEDPTKKIRCLCGTAACRKYLN
jgi:histone-lysine N-methyltransferase SETD1